MTVKMPSPINSPTSNQTTGSSSWPVNRESTGTQMSVDFPFARQQDAETRTDDLQKLSISECQSEEQANKKQLIFGCAAESSKSKSDRPSRLGLRLDLRSVNTTNDNLSEPNTSKKTLLTLETNSHLKTGELTCQQVDVSVPLEYQCWFHGYITRLDAEKLLKPTRAGTYLVRTANCDNSKFDFSLSLKTGSGFMHIKIVRTVNGYFTLANLSQPFANVPQLISHFTRHKLPVRGAQHLSLLNPLVDQLL